MSVRARKRALRWAWAGMTLSVLADCGVTASQVWADRQGEARSVAAKGEALWAEFSPPDKEGDRQVRLAVRFPTPNGPHVGETGVLLRNGANPRLSRPLEVWLRRLKQGVPAARAPGPQIAVRYDPTWPGRFWVDEHTWDDFSFARFFLMALPAMQLLWLLMDAPNTFRGAVPDDTALSAMGPWAVAVVTLPLLLFCGVMQRLGW